MYDKQPTLRSVTFHLQAQRIPSPTGQLPLLASFEQQQANSQTSTGAPKLAAAHLSALEQAAHRPQRKDVADTLCACDVIIAARQLCNGDERLQKGGLAQAFGQNTEKTEQAAGCCKGPTSAQQAPALQRVAARTPASRRAAG